MFLLIQWVQFHNSERNRLSLKIYVENTDHLHISWEDVFLNRHNKDIFKPLIRKIRVFKTFIPMCNLDSDGCNSCDSARCSMTCGSPGLHLHLHLDCLHLHHQQTHPASTPTSRALLLTEPPCSDLLKIPSLVGGLCWAATPSVTQKSAVTGVRQEKEIL